MSYRILSADELQKLECGEYYPFAVVELDRVEQSIYLAIDKKNPTAYCLVTLYDLEGGKWQHVDVLGFPDMRDIILNPYAYVDLAKAMTLALEPRYQPDSQREMMISVCRWVVFFTLGILGVEYLLYLQASAVSILLLIAGSLLSMVGAFLMLEDGSVTPLNIGFKVGAITAFCLTCTWFIVALIHAGASATSSIPLG